MPQRLLLFDIDGTLVSSPTKAGKIAFESAMEKVAGVRQGLADVVLHGNTDPAILDEAWISKFGRLPTQQESEQVLSNYVLYLKEHLSVPGRMVLLPSVREFITSARCAECMIGLATGNIEHGAMVKLESVGLWHEFEVGGYGSDSKNRPELVLAGIKKAEERAKTSFAKNKIWVIGDTPRDISAAQAAGVMSIGVATGIYDIATLKKAGADVCCQLLSEIDPHTL